MNPFLRAAGLAVVGALVSLPVRGAAPTVRPVTPDAMPEAVALLQVLRDISGQHTLSGQHNYPATKDRNSQFAARYIGHAPAVFSTDWGYAGAGDTDSYLARPEVVRECIREHQLGAIITICWHAVPPTADEPVTFAPAPGSDPQALKSVQGRLLDEQFRDVLTPGTPLYRHWCDQVDTIAGDLKQLEDAHVPVLWRPYHEMNGGWFWWGGRTGEYGSAALFRQLFDRLVNHHHLRNLIWVWSVDRSTRPGTEHEKFFPGIDYVDVLGLDVYQGDFAQSYYDSLVKLSQGKPLALAEVGSPPTPEILEQQPRWTYYVTWAGMVRNTTRKQYDALMRGPRILNLDDPAYAEITSSYRAVCGLPPVHVATPPADFSGTWVLNEDQSDLGRGGNTWVPARMDVVQRGNVLTVRSTRILEYADDQVTEQTHVLEPADAKPDPAAAARTNTAQLSPHGDEIWLTSHIHVTWGPPGTILTVRETWKLLGGNRQLSIERVSSSVVGEQRQLMVFDRR